MAVDAVYNLLCIKMGPFILVDPYTFDDKLPKIWNYAINAVFSHELGHGFDPRGIFVAGKGEFSPLLKFLHK